MNKFLDITPQTIVGELLNTYPELEDELIRISPVFQKLKNPVMRKTVAKVATLKQAAMIANISTAQLINALRSAVNLDKISIEEDKKSVQQKPGWINSEKIKFEYDISIDLENGLHPAAKVTKEVLQLNNDEIYLLISPFIPAPLIKILEEKGFDVYTGEQNEGTFHNYIKKK
ncbi:MAG: DUF1858 domain-containing protein [Ignavibacteriales bacterium]|nr:DUF1858 domain-containing protein [Ignavibacteriales bacterium]